MKILVKDNVVREYAPCIDFLADSVGADMWRLANDEGVLIYYRVDVGYTLFENVTLPDDFVRGKYLFVNNEFVLNPDWSEVKTPEQRIEELEEAIQVQQEELIMLNDILLEILMG